MKFSLILPVYNVDRFLQECLDSIVKQTFNDFEVICIDDGSTDNSSEILKQYRNKYEYFKVITQENKGQGIARNIGIDEAKGEYICFIDPDDYISEFYIEELSKICNKTCADVIQFNFKYIYDNGTTKYCNKSEMIEEYSNIELHKIKNYNLNDLTNNNFLMIMHNCWGGIYKKSFIKKMI